jgi:hypothetical protein
MRGSIKIISLGLLAGLLSTPILLLLSYLVGVVLTAIKTREVLTTVLVAGSLLPLMLLFGVTCSDVDSLSVDWAGDRHRGKSESVVSPADRFNLWDSVC